MGTTILRRIAAAVIERIDGKVLLLKRSATRTTNPGKWCVVTGYVEANEHPRQAAIRELFEELNIKAKPVLGGQIVIVETPGGDTLHVYPFLFQVGFVDVVLDQEHEDYAWIDPGEVYKYDTVQQLADDLKSVGVL